MCIRASVLIGNNVIFRCLDGKVVLNKLTNGGGKIRIGFRGMVIQNERDRKTILDLRKDSELVLAGSASIGDGARIYTKGILIIGDNFYLSLDSKIIAHDKIQFGNDCTVGWDSLIMDTDFHRVRNITSGEYYPMTKSINIGNHCWICNNVQILKGTRIPDDTIVGSCSLLNKVYDIPNGSLLAGNPAKLKKTGISHER